MDKISNFVNTLPESLKTAFTLRESEGKSYEEISMITNTPIGTVRSRILEQEKSIIEYMKKELIIMNDIKKKISAFMMES